MTAATAGWSSTQRVATLAIDTPCLRGDLRAARRIAWKTAQPPIASTKRLYLLLLQSAMSPSAGSGRPSHARTGARRPAFRRPAA